MKLTGESLGERLANARPRRITQNDAARALGVSRMTIWNWENGESRPTEAHLAKLAAFYGVELAELLGKGA